MIARDAVIIAEAYTIQAFTATGYQNAAIRGHLVIIEYKQQIIPVNTRIAPNSTITNTAIFKDILWVFLKVFQMQLKKVTDAVQTVDFLK